MRHSRVLWDGLAVTLVALGLSLGGWALTQTSSGASSSCEDFSQLHADDGHPHPGMASLARLQSVTVSRVSGGGLQVAWLFGPHDPSLSQVTVGELHVDIRQGSRELVLAAPTFGSTAWSQMGQGVNVARAQQLPGEVTVTYSRAQIFDLSGSFVWNAGVDYWLVHGSVTSRCPPLGSADVSG